MSRPAVAPALRRPVDPRYTVSLAVLTTAAAAWVVLLLSAGHGGLDHHLLGDALTARADGAGPRLLVPPGPGPVAAAALALTGWGLMVVAMMLPPALPLLLVLRGLATGAGHAVVAAGVAAYVAVWLGVGAVLLAGDTLLHLATAGREWWLAHPYVVLGAVLLVAGGHQLSPLKQSCLRACRSPRGFAVAHWRGERPPAVEAAVVAGRYGVSCAGCCWALMAVSFAVGAAAVPVMVLLAVVTGAERLAPGGRRLTRPAGLLALAAGGALLASSALPG